MIEERGGARKIEEVRRIYVLQSKVFSSVWGLEQDVIQFALLARLALPPFSAALFNLAFKPNCLCCRNVNLESASF